MVTPPSTIDELNDLEATISAWAENERRDNPVVASVEADESSERRWFIRLHGDEKSVFSVWFHLRQRSLHVETYLMPYPEERHAECFEYLLRRSRNLIDFRCCIGDEDAVFLAAEVPNHTVDTDVLDRLLGAAYVYTEQLFRPAMRIGFGSRFRPAGDPT